MDPNSSQVLITMHILNLFELGNDVLHFENKQENTRDNVSFLLLKLHFLNEESSPLSAAHAL